MQPDPFELLGLPCSFDLDQGEIERAYFARSSSVHPDLAAGDDDAQRTMALLNEAKRILDDPERRASALLRQLGGPAREQDKSLPPDFLMEIMEVREAVEEAIGQQDAARQQEAREHWEAWAEQERHKAIAEVGDMFRNLGDPPAAPELKAIRTRLNAWRYIERLIEQLDPEYDPGRADFE